MYRDFLTRKFSHRPSSGLFVAPQLPGAKLGRILMKETRVQQPGDVVVMFMDSGIFGSTYVLLTDTKLFWPGGELDLERVRSAESDGKNLVVMRGSNTGTDQVNIKIGDRDAAATIAKVLDDLAYYDPSKTKELETKERDYSAFEGSAVDWLLLRDEVLKTIDLLHEKFQDGKLSLIEYETKKQELLDRI